MADAAQRANSRAVEERRLRAVDGRDIASKRGAEVFVADPHKTFDMTRSPLGAGRMYATNKAGVKEFAYEQKVNPSKFNARDFYGAKSARVAEKSYATAEANTRSYREGGKEAPTKTAATREARESSKLAATRDAKLSNG